MARKDLHNLIRLNEWQVDEKRRRLGELLQVLDDLEHRAQALEDEVAREQQLASEAPETGLYYGNYAETVIERRERLAQSIQQAEEAVRQAREELRDAYRDLKKYEVAQQNRDRKAAEELAKREQLVLDEIGLQGYRRQREV